jgi:hypothetical protein
MNHTNGEFQPIGWQYRYKSKVAPSTINLKMISHILKHYVNFKNITLMLKHQDNPI